MLRAQGNSGAALTGLAAIDHNEHESTDSKEHIGRRLRCDSNLSNKFSEEPIDTSASIVEVPKPFRITSKLLKEVQYPSLYFCDDGR